MTKRNAIYAQSGGVTAVINATACGVIETARRQRNRVRKSNHPYRWTIGVAELKDIANREKMLPREFISADGYHITAKCRQYLAPLIRGEDPPPYKDGLPRYMKPRNVAVKKILRDEFKV